jgi:hypothetical protein
MLRLALFLSASLAASSAWGDETCRYSGTTSHSGHVTVESKAVSANGETTVDVAARVGARSFGLIDWQYLYQEIGTFRGRELRSVAVNHRYSVAGSIRRQSWDQFTREPEGMSAYRVQAKTLDSMRTRHPGFVRHWDLSSFGEPWSRDYAGAPPERRADLDLARTEMPAGLGTPLTMAFYWVRWVGQEPATVPVFLPGFKQNARADIQVVSMGIETGGLRHVHSTVRPPRLSETLESTGDAWISPDHHLVRVTFDARGDLGEATGELHLDGCTGDAPSP